MSIVWKALQSVLVVFAQCRIQNTIWSTFLFLEEHILFKFSFLSNLSWLSLLKSLFYFIFYDYSMKTRECAWLLQRFSNKTFRNTTDFYFIFFNIPKSNHHLFYLILFYIVTFYTLWSFRWLVTLFHLWSQQCKMTESIYC